MPFLTTLAGGSSKGFGAGSGGSGSAGSEQNPITNDADGAAWVAAIGANSGPAYVQKAGLNGGNPYEVYCVYSDNKLWVMAGVFAGNDSTNSSSGNGFYRWAPCQSPTNTPNNDWGTATHTFNDNYDFSGYTQANRSARSRAWAELASTQTRFYFYNQSQSSPLIYTFSGSATWGDRMKSVSDYFRNGTSSSIASNNIVGNVPSGSLQDTRWSRLGLGASDGEAANANSNDVIMIIAQGTTSNGTNSSWDSSGQQHAGLGVKRSQANNGYPSNFTFNRDGDGNFTNDSKAGVIAKPGCYNGTIAFDTDGYITIYVAIQ